MLRIGILDSGLDPDYQPPQGCKLTYAFIDGSGEFIPGHSPEDETGHGTAMARIISETFHANFRHQAECELVCVAVTESGQRYARILSGLLWLSSQSLNILNLSIGVPGHNPIFRPAIQHLIDNNTVVVASIGNGGPGLHSSPGDYPEVISVGSMDEMGRVTPYSGSYNEGLRCKKPDLLSCVPKEQSGTSIATSVASGLVASLLVTEPKLNPATIKQILVQTASALPYGQAHRSRAGSINIDSALDAIRKKMKLTVSKPLPLSFYRDPRLSASFSYLASESKIRVILYLESQYEKELNNSIRLGLQQGEFCNLASWSAHGYSVITITKRWLVKVWEDERILMISLAQ